MIKYKNAVNSNQSNTRKRPLDASDDDLDLAESAAAMPPLPNFIPASLAADTSEYTRYELELVQLKAANKELKQYNTILEARVNNLGKSEYDQDNFEIKYKKRIKTLEEESKRLLDANTQLLQVNNELRAILQGSSLPLGQPRSMLFSQGYLPMPNNTLGAISQSYNASPPPAFLPYNPNFKNNS